MKIELNKGFLFSAFWWVTSFLILFLYRINYSFDNLLSTAFVFNGIDLASLFACSYFLNRYLIPKYLAKKKVLLFVFFLILLTFVISNAIQLLQWFWYQQIGTLNNQEFEVLKQFTYQVFNSYMVVFFGCICITIFKLLAEQWLSQTRYEKLQKEKAQTELQFLKAQINPHFLFNSINSIFAHIDKSNVTAREMVLKFSDMLRYQLYDCNVDMISFEREFAYLNNYILLQRLRKEENLQVTIETKGEMFGFEIAPLLLIPFIENAFKYVSNHDKNPNVLKVTLIKEVHSFVFHCVNTKDRIVSRDVVAYGGIGINNVKRRLELLYPEKHKLKITDNDLTFEVNLKIEIA